MACLRGVALVGALLCSQVGLAAAEPAALGTAPTAAAPSSQPVANRASMDTPHDETLPPLPLGLSPELRAYLEALRDEVTELRRRLNQGEKPDPVTPPGAIPSTSALAAAPPVPAARTLIAPLASRLQIGGYGQIRVTNVGNSAGDRTAPHDNFDFQLARFRPRLTYYMDPHWQADLQVNVNTRGATATSFQARDAYIEYHNGKNNQYALRLGQQKVPFGFETFVEGDEQRPALERARYHDVLAPDQRDPGLGILWNPRRLPVTQALFRGPLVAVGVFNGSGTNRQDNDESKNLIAAARYPLGQHHTLGISGISGTFSRAPGQTFVRQVVDLDWESYYGRLRTQAEVMLGRNLGHDINGGYGQVEYRTGAPGNFFARYDWFDRNEEVGRDYWKRWSFGWYRDFTRNIRITAEYDYVTNQLTQTRHPNTFGLQVLGSF